MAKSTSPKKKSLSWAALVRAVMALVPWLLGELNKDKSSNEETVVFFSHDAVTGKLRVSGNSPEARPFVRTVSVRDAGPTEGK
jgi:hypothetical protein